MRWSPRNRHPIAGALGIHPRNGTKPTQNIHLSRMNGVKPIRTVVWDPWLALAVSHGDPVGWPSSIRFGQHFRVSR